MKKKKLYLTATAIFLILVIIIIVIFTMNKKLVMGEKREKGDFIEIYELNDGRKLYSEFNDIKYISKTKQEYSLSDALKNKKTTLNSILFRKNVRLYLNDGGTKVYEYRSSSNPFINKDISICVCNAITGSSDTGVSTRDTDIYIVATEDYMSITPCGAS